MTSSPPRSSGLYQVRPAVPKDLQPLADVLTQSFYPPTQWRYWLYPLLYFSIYEDLKQRLQNPPQIYGCLAAVTAAGSEEKVVGTVEITLRRYAPWVWYRPRQLYLSNLAVRESARQQGVARQLLEACDRWAMAWGFQELYLHVMEDNPRARRVYHQAGYRLCHIEPDPLAWLMGPWLPPSPRRLLLRKSLIPGHPPSVP